MKDIINERDKKEKMRNSIVKWWNVHYMTPEELEQEQEKEQDSSASESGDGTGTTGEKPGMKTGKAAGEEEEEAPQDIINRLNREAEASEDRLQKQIEAVRQEMEERFNMATGAYSGSYGSGGADEKHQEQISAILAEKEDALRDLIEQSGEEDSE